MKPQIDYISENSCNSLSELFLERVSRSPESTAYRYFDTNLEMWQPITWAEMGLIVSRWRQAMLKENLTKGDRVAIMLGNSPEWVAYEQAAFSLGLIVVPLYANDRPENLGYILNHTESRLLLCSGDTYYKYLAKPLQHVKSLQRIITVGNNTQSEEGSLVTCLPDWLPDGLVSDTFAVTTTETASIVYTSGTTGLPKGVMLSHKNILSNAHAGLQCIDIYPSDSFLSFLPLSHMLERTAGYVLPMMAGACVSFARSIPELAEDLLFIKPTVLVSVPRIFEKIYGGIKATVQQKSAKMQQLFRTAVETGYKSFLVRQNRSEWESSLLLLPLLDRLIAKKVRDKLGGRLRVIITGGAPLSAEISKFFIGLGLPLYQGYGLTETSPIISVNRVEDNRPEGVGKPVPGVEVKIGENSELLARGSCVMQGYWKNQTATDKTFTQDGWLRTGDQAVIEDGHIRITGRLKEIIVLSNGEKVALADLEMAISTDPLFDQAIVIGEGRPFLTALAVLNQHLWEELAGELEVSPDPSSLQLPVVKETVLKRLEQQLSGFPGYVVIKNVSLSLAPWTVEGGLLTPTLKLKRPVIEKQLGGDISEMYQ